MFFSECFPNDDFPVTKVEVLAIFAKSDDFLKPDEVLEKLRSGLDRRSFYSYLGRLRRQGLLDFGTVTRAGPPDIASNPLQSQMLWPVYPLLPERRAWQE